MHKNRNILKLYCFLTFQVSLKHKYFSQPKSDQHVLYNSIVLSEVKCLHSEFYILKMFLTLLYLLL
jgi:hypothetical protein